MPPYRTSLASVPRTRVVGLGRGALITLAILTAPGAGVAEPGEGWDPFGQLDTQPRRRSRPSAPVPAPFDAVDDAGYPIGPPGGQTTAPAVDERARGVEKADLAPLALPETAPPAGDAWSGIDPALLAGLELPPRSPTLSSLWRGLFSGPGSLDTSGDPKMTTIRAEAAYRSGLLGEAEKLVGGFSTAFQPDATLSAIATRLEIAGGNTDKGCERLKTFIRRKNELPSKLQGEALLMTGICAAAGGNRSGAGLAAEFARQEKSLVGADDSVSLQALDAIAGDAKTPARVKSLSALQYRAFALAGGVEMREGPKLDAARTALLVREPGSDPETALQSAEAAARLNISTAEALATAYDLATSKLPSEPVSAPSNRGPQLGSSLRRAALYKAAVGEKTPLKKVRLLRAFLDEAKRAGLHLAALSLVSPLAETLQPVPEIGWFAETGIEIGLIGGRLDRARQWSNLGGSMPGDGGLRHWQALIDIADPTLKTERGRSLASVEDLASHGKLATPALHRLLTVLDANDIDVPLALWDMANTTPPDTAGYLPPTGVLTRLQDAAKNKDRVRTVVLVLTAIGPQGPENANLIALGDSIRALRRAGFEAEARRLSVEALFPFWPRHALN